MLFKFFTPAPRFLESNISTIENESTIEASPIPSSIERPSEEPKVFKNGGYLESDPAKRTAILDYHPNDQDEFKRAYLVNGPTKPNMTEYPPRDIGGKSRSFNNNWYKGNNWLEYSIENDVVFCLPCYLFYNGTSNDAFVKKGYSGWNLKNRLNKHVGKNPNSHHKNCIKACANFMKKNQSIESLFVKHSTKGEADYFVRIKASLEAVKFLVRGGMAFKAHNEGEDSIYKGHFLEFIEALGRNNERIAESFISAGGNCKMTCPTIQKELAKIVGEIGDGFFSVLVDESGDCSSKEQMTVVVRFVDDRGFVVERFIGIVQALSRHE